MTNILAFFVFFSTNIVVTENADRMTQIEDIGANHVLTYVHENVTYSVTNLVPFSHKSRFFRRTEIWEEITTPPIMAGPGLTLTNDGTNIVILNAPFFKTNWVWPKPLENVWTNAAIPVQEPPMSIDNTNLMADFSNRSLTIGFRPERDGPFMTHVMLGTNRVMAPMGNADTPLRPADPPAMVVPFAETWTNRVPLAIRAKQPDSTFYGLHWQDGELLFNTETGKIYAVMGKMNILEPWKAMDFTYGTGRQETNGLRFWQKDPPWVIPGIWSPEMFYSLRSWNIPSQP